MNTLYQPIGACLTTSFRSFHLLPSLRPLLPLCCGPAQALRLSSLQQQNITENALPLSQFTASSPFTSPKPVFNQELPASEEIKPAILDGRVVRDDVLSRLKKHISLMTEKCGVRPSLKILLVGSDPASSIYVREKITASRRIGIAADIVRMPENVASKQVEEQVLRLSDDPSVHGIVVQQPLPSKMDLSKVINCISPDKDVDGVTELSLGKLVSGNPSLVPCTPRAVIALLQYYNIPINNRNVVVVGRGLLVGRPLTVLLGGRVPSLNCNVTAVQTGTQPSSLARVTRNADILVTATGVTDIITPVHVQPGAVIIDVGINCVEEKRTGGPCDDSPISSKPNTRKQRRGRRIVGDVSHSVYPALSAYSPVPGGVGPVTVAMLLANTVVAAHRLATPELPNLMLNDLPGFRGGLC